MNEKKLANSKWRYRQLVYADKNAFTLIELLAIIVILAIIAVITIPILLNVIENSRKGAATDSAYGFKDSINKYYITKLSEDRRFQLEGPYTISNGYISGANITNSVEIPISGTIPSSGTLTYENNVLKNGCLVIGEYAVTFNNDGTTNTEKGECTPTMEEMCPNCYFGTIYFPTKVGDPLPANFSKNYPTGEFANYFLGYTVDDTTGLISRSFVCGKKNNKYFCIENGKTSYEEIYNITKHFGCSESDYEQKAHLTCSGADVNISLMNGNKIGIVLSSPSNGASFCETDTGIYSYCGT